MTNLLKFGWFVRKLLQEVSHQKTDSSLKIFIHSYVYIFPKGMYMLIK